MKKLLLTALFVLGMVLNASVQLPKVTLKSIDGKTVSTDTLSNNGKPTSSPHGASLATASLLPSVRCMRIGRQRQE